jgi:small subunit ribosomal protein S20
MANTKSAAKRARQTLKRSVRNRSALGRLRTLQKVALLDEKRDAEKVRALISAIDKAAKRGMIHRNAARRRKARLQKFVAAAGATRK